MLRETIEWRSVNDELPDADTTVLICMPDAPSEPIWLGWYDSAERCWYSVDASEQLGVTMWAPMPAATSGPQLKASEKP